MNEINKKKKKKTLTNNRKITRKLVFIEVNLHKQKVGK